ncbi:hypothetical protein [Chryseolinea lacunae]|uniref:Zinc-finger domain-containing protein n=1 Tax=Chryseolinea lacunae TaxID=2801331 RepID=A0ABS1KZ55_9BACT|nr:hypothetical protein [Chryseolinea lacunae]MBL0743962.1 hypothetical protein [Chryseolinea lacunae]
MVSEKDFEALDHYVGNRLNAADKAAFEQKLADDAALRKELNVQQQIAEGLRTARAAELKQLLKNVPLSSLPSAGPSLLVRVGLWTVAAGVVATGLYFYLRPSENTVASAETATVTAPIEMKQDAVAPEAQPKPEEVTVPAEVPAATLRKADEKPAAKTQQADVKPEERKALEPFDPSETAENTSPAKTDDAAPAVVSSKSRIVVETDTNNKKYTFHYQLKENKLMLYGPFEQNLYEILEFFTDNKRTTFLFYNSNYYQLNDEGDKIRSLTPIKDPELLKKLKEYRKH